MRTTIELPDQTLRQAKTLAASLGTTLKQLFTEALHEKLNRYAAAPLASDTGPPWMAGFGALADLADENKRVLHEIDAAFESLDPEDLA